MFIHVACRTGAIGHIEYTKVYVVYMIYAGTKCAYNMVRVERSGVLVVFDAYAHAREERT